MAQIPGLEISTRKLDAYQPRQIAPDDRGRIMQEAGRTIQWGGEQLERVREVMRRADEREAEYAVQLADNFVRNGWLGTDTRDETTGAWKHDPGVADRTWEQMRDDKTTPLDEMRRLQKAVREQEFYTNLTPAQKKVFERKWAFKADAHSRAAQSHHQQLTLARIQDETKRTIAMRGEEVGRVYGADDQTYARVASRNALLNWADMQGTALSEASRTMLDDPRCNFADIAKSQGWDDRTRALKLHEYKQVALAFDINRITALQQAAATGRGLGAYTPEQCADLADRITDALNGNIYGLRPDGTKKGTGWLGNVGDAKEALTEFSIRDGEDDGSDAVRDADGNLIDYPTLVPGLEKDEVEAVKKAAAGDKDVFDSVEWELVVAKARAHAKKRIAEGKSVWADSGSGDEMISDEQAMSIREETEKARRNLAMVVSKRQGDTAAAIDRKLDEIQWKMAYNLTETGGEFDVSKAIGADLGDMDAIAKDIAYDVESGGISHAQGMKLLARYQKLREARNALFDDAQHQERFAQHSNSEAWVRVKMMIANANRDGTPAEQLEQAVEDIKYSLTAKDYFSLWHDARKMRDEEDDRISSQVFAAFLDVSEETIAAASNRGIRGTPRSDSAIETLLGSSKAEYVQSGRMNDPDFKIEDVDEAMSLVKDYLAKHPGDRTGADNLLRELVEPLSRSARAKSFRDRIRDVRRYERMNGNAGVYSVQRAYAEEDSKNGK